MGMVCVCGKSVPWAWSLQKANEIYSTEGICSRKRLDACMIPPEHGYGCIFMHASNQERPSKHFSSTKEAHVLTLSAGPEFQCLAPLTFPTMIELICPT
eukprot:6203844-Pleurochrysis_carterae.AAC.2